MAIVYACIRPRMPCDEAEHARTAAAIRRVAEELASHRPEVLILITSPSPASRDKIGVLTAEEISLGGEPDQLTLATDGELGERILAEAAKETLPVAPIHRLKGGQLGDVPSLAEALADTRFVVTVTARLTPRFHFDFGHSIARALAGDERRVACLCLADLEIAPPAGGRDEYSPARRVFAERYRRVFDKWDVKWLTGLDSGYRQEAREDAVSQTAVLMGALSSYRIEPRVLSYEPLADVGQLVAAIDVAGLRRGNPPQRS